VLVLRELPTSGCVRDLVVLRRGRPDSVTGGTSPERMGPSPMIAPGVTGAISGLPANPFDSSPDGDEEDDA